MKIISLLFLFILTSCASYPGKIPYSVIKDVYYTDAKDIRLQGDIFIPKAQGTYPVVVVVHGGGWKSRSRGDTESIARSISSHGFVVFNINYRFAPKYLHPSAIEDLKHAVEYLKANSQKYQIDSTRIGLWGYSSGAHTTSYYALTHPGIKAVVAGGGPYDFTWYPESPLIKGYMGKYRDEMLNEYFKASVNDHIRKDAPPFFLYHGRSDTLVEYAQMSAFAARLKQKGVYVQTLDVKFWGHMLAFAIVDKPVEEGIKFLKMQLQDQ